MRERERERSNAAIDKRQEPPPCQRRWGKKNIKKKELDMSGVCTVNVSIYIFYYC